MAFFDKTERMNQENVFYTVKFLRCKRLWWNLLESFRWLEMRVSVTRPYLLKLRPVAHTMTSQRNRAFAWRVWLFPYFFQIGGVGKDKSNHCFNHITVYQIIGAHLLPPLYAERIACWRNRALDNMASNVCSHDSESLLGSP